MKMTHPPQYCSTALISMKVNWEALIAFLTHGEGSWMQTTMALVAQSLTLAVYAGNSSWHGRSVQSEVQKMC